MHLNTNMKLMTTKLMNMEISFDDVDMFYYILKNSKGDGEKTMFKLSNDN